MTLFVTLADTSQRVGATAARSAKIRELAELLTQLQPEEIGIAVHYLSGEMTQGRIGIGPAAVSRTAALPAADVPTLSIAAVDRRLTALAAISGASSATHRAAALRELFALATAPRSRAYIAARRTCGALTPAAAAIASAMTPASAP